MVWQENWVDSRLIDGAGGGRTQGDRTNKMWHFKLC